MTYDLGIDLGTTFTAAAVNDAAGSRIVGLSHDRVAVPSFIAPLAGRWLVGDEATAVSATTPWNVAKEFKRRFGDPTPMYLDGTPYAPDQLMGQLLAWVIRRTEELEGRPADRIVVTHPATWGTYKLDLLREVAADLSLPPIDLLSEPAAAALHYHARQRVAVGSTIAVYDLGGGTFDVTLLERSSDNFEFLAGGGLERAGGLDLDAAVFGLVTDSISGHFDELDSEDLAAQRAVARLREECTRAKIALTYDTRAIVPVVLPGLVTEVLVQRGEFEDLVEPLVSETVQATAEAIERAGIDRDPDSVLLVGGSSRVPIVSQLLARTLGIPIVVDTHPKHAVALGAVARASEDATDPAAFVPRTSFFADDQVLEQQDFPETTVSIPAEMTTSIELRQRFLVVLSGELGGRVIDLPSGTTVVGRNEADGVWGLSSRLVSRRHAEITRNGTTLHLSDLGSTNGTWVDGVRVAGAPVPLEPGSIIDVAGTLVLVDGPGAPMESTSVLLRSFSLPPAPAVKRRQRKSASAEWVRELELRRQLVLTAGQRVQRSRRFEGASAAMVEFWRGHLSGRLAQTSRAPGSVVLGWASMPSLLDLELPDFLTSDDRDQALLILADLLQDPSVPLVVPLLGETTIIQCAGAEAAGIASSLLADLRHSSPTVDVEVVPNGRGGVSAFRLDASNSGGGPQVGSAASQQGSVVFEADPQTPPATATVSVDDQQATYRSSSVTIEFVPATLSLQA